MMQDYLNTLCDGVTLGGSTGVANIGDLIDTGGDGLNDVDHLYLVIQITTAATSGGSATAKFHLVSDATSTVSTTTRTVHHTTAEFAVAALVAGLYVTKVALPKGTYERYVGVQQEVGTAALTGGVLHAFLTPDVPTFKAFPEAN